MLELYVDFRDFSKVIVGKVPSLQCIFALETIH